MADANFVQADTPIDFTPSAALRGGSVVLLALGLAAITASAIAAGETGAAHLEGVFDVSAATGTVFTDGEAVFWDDAAKLAVNAGAATASFRIGRAVGAKASGPLIVRVELNAQTGVAVRGQIMADSAPVTNSIVETVVATVTIPANSLKKSRVLRFLAAMIATATNATDTFRGRVRLGGLAGTVVADTTAIDLANGDTGVLSGDIVIRTEGAGGTFVAASLSMLKTTASPLVVDSTAIDTTVAQTLVFTIVESVASAGNSAKASAFNVQLI